MFKPPKTVQKVAALGLLERRKWSGVKNKPGTSVGVARARDLKNGKSISLSTLKRMKSFFDRHDHNERSTRRDSKGRLGRAEVSWLLWGGTPARKWVLRELKKEL